MTNVIVSGFPENCKLNKMVFLFKGTFKKANIHKFWIKDMSDERSHSLKTATFEFFYPEEVDKAMQILNGFKFHLNDRIYSLTARLQNQLMRQSDRRPHRRSPSPYRRERDYERYDDRERYSSGYARERSRSPLKNDATQLDLEIELLRKRRLIIEEERKLLLERKKLELVKEFGPRAIKEFEVSESRERDRYSRPRREEYRPRPPSPKRRARSPRPKPYIKKERERKPMEPTLPFFILPCKLLIGEMKEVINTHATRKESFLLDKLVRSSLRKRLAFVLDGKPMMPTKEIVVLYRETYPKEDDEKFILKNLKDLRAYYYNNMPEEEKVSTNKAAYKRAPNDEGKTGKGVKADSKKTKLETEVAKVENGDPKAMDEEVKMKKDSEASIVEEGIDKEKTGTAVNVKEELLEAPEPPIISEEANELKAMSEENDTPQEELKDVAKVQATTQVQAIPKAETSPQVKAIPKVETTPQDKVIPQVETTPEVKNTTQDKATPNAEATGQVKAIPKVEDTSQVEATPQTDAKSQDESMSQEDATQELTTAKELSQESTLTLEGLDESQHSVDERAEFALSINTSEVVMALDGQDWPEGDDWNDDNEKADEQ